MSSFIKNFIVFILSIVIVLFLTELISGQVLKFKNKTDLSKLDKQIDSNIALYSEYPWASDYFKGIKENPNPGYSFFPYAMWNTKNWNSKLVNIDNNGVRRTFNQSKNTQNVYRIYMFGGSTMENTEVPDEYTISSHVSKILNESKLTDEYRFDVVNFGSGGYSSTQQLIRLLFEAQRDFKDYGKPDLVIFYDGVNDVFSGIYLEHPGLHDAFDRIKMRYDNINGFYIQKLTELLAEKSKTYQLINDFLNINRKEDDRYFESKVANYKKSAVDTAQIYKNNINIINSLGSQYGFDSIFFLQPQIFISKELSQHDNDIKDRWLLNRPRMARAYEAGYTEFKKLTDANIMIDLTNTFNNLPATGAIRGSLLLPIVEFSESNSVKLKNTT